MPKAVIILIKYLKKRGAVMSFSKAICPKCHAEVTVNTAEEASICSSCAAPFITSKAVDSFTALKKEAATDTDALPGPYRITLRRTHNSLIGDSVTFILIADGRPRPLADNAYTSIIEDKKYFEIPVFITDNDKKRFEGVLTGVADGRDIDILWDAELKNQTLGKIIETTNSSVTFIGRPGATDNW